MIREYDAWPHTRHRLSLLRALEITDAERWRNDAIEATFDAEDRAFLAAARVTKRIQAAVQRLATWGLEGNR